MRSSHTDRAIWMALGLCVTEMAVSLNLSRPYTWLAWVTASLKTCSYLFWLRTAPMFTIFGSQPARAQEHEKSTASRNRRIVWTTKQHSAARSLFSPEAGRLDQLLEGGTAQASGELDCRHDPGGRRERGGGEGVGWGGGRPKKEEEGWEKKKIGGFMCNAEECA